MKKSAVASQNRRIGETSMQQISHERREKNERPEQTVTEMLRWEWTGKKGIWYRPLLDYFW